MDSNRIERLARGIRAVLIKEIGDSYDRITRPESPERLAEPTVIQRIEGLARTLGGRDALVERVAYTWFNRLCALRFMDEKGYTPAGIVTARSGETLPAVLADARRGSICPALSLSEAQASRVRGLLDGTIPAPDATGEAYVLLLLAACDMYEASMGYLFGGDVDLRHAMRLLAPAGLLNRGSLLDRIAQGMDAEACQSVEVLGWLYQFYVSERKDEFFASKRKASAADIAPATQLFTPNWIVRYLVENSLGRLWMLNNPGSALAERMEYYIAPNPEDVEDFLRVYSPEDLTLCDPACGSGHILVYAFELLYAIYEEEGYLPEEIPQLIFEHNLHGLEIDRRAAEIASFALEMCAREKDPHFFEKNVDAHITVLDPVSLDAQELADAGLLAGSTRLLEAFEHLNEVGSLYVPDAGDAILIENAIDNLRAQQGMFAGKTIAKLEDMRQKLKALAGPYTCMVANPPYIQKSKLNTWAAKWVEQNYKDEKSDLCTCFIKRGFSLACERGYNAMVTMHSWMFLSSYEKMRAWLIANKGILTMAHLGARAFDQIGGEVVQVCATSFWNGPSAGQGTYIRLVDLVGGAEKNAALLEAIQDTACNWRYRAQQTDFSAIPGRVFAYWASSSMRAAFQKYPPLGALIPGSVGIQTGDNPRFIRSWWEVTHSNIGFGLTSIAELMVSDCRWYPLNKGGSYRKWYGNDFEVINWYHDGAQVKALGQGETRHVQDYRSDLKLAEVVTWSKIGGDSFRYKPVGYLSDMAGIGVYPAQYARSYCALLNSTLAATFLEVFSPTITTSVGEVKKIPVNEEALNSKNDEIVQSAIAYSKDDWDAFETSWDFSVHPLAQPGESLIRRQFARWQRECDGRFSQLKANEEELNRIFARIYNMEGEVPIEVPDDKVSVRRADAVRDVKSLISYAVGCIFGRYSTTAPGLVLADARQTVDDFMSKVPDATFVPCSTNVAPISTVEDVMYQDDMVRQFQRWLQDTYGEDAFEENLAFIEQTLGKDLRTYFVKDFYKDHCNTYQVTGSGKRPIYWLFSSPKGAFQTLVYMHRMTRDTVSTVLAEYVRPHRQGLAARAQELEVSGNARDAARAAKLRHMVTEIETWERDVLYPLSQQHVEIDLDDGVKVNYKKFGPALAKVQGLS